MPLLCSLPQRLLERSAKRRVLTTTQSTTCNRKRDGADMRCWLPLGESARHVRLPEAKSIGAVLPVSPHPQSAAVPQNIISGGRSVMATCYGTITSSEIFLRRAYLTRKTP